METRKYSLMKEASLRLEEAQKAMQALAEAEANEDWKKKYEAKLAMLHELQEDIDTVTQAADATWARIIYKLLRLKKEEFLAIIKASCEGKIYKISELDQMIKDYPEDTVNIIKSAQKNVNWDYFNWFSWHPEEKFLECHTRLSRFIVSDSRHWRLNDQMAVICQKRIEKILNDDALSKMLGYKEKTIEKFRKTVDWDHKMK